MTCRATQGSSRTGWEQDRGLGESLGQPLLGLLQEKHNSAGNSLGLAALNNFSGLWGRRAVLSCLAFGPG